MIHSRLASSRGHKGFTLIETLIYIALLGVIMTGIIVTVYPLLSGAERLSARVVSDTEAAFVLRKIAWALSSDVSGIDDSDPAILKIDKSGGAVWFRESGGAIEISEDGGSTWYLLTASRVSFSDFSVSYKPSTDVGVPHVVKVGFLADGMQFSQTYNVFIP